jgi:phage gp29-like protein
MSQLGARKKREQRALAAPAVVAADRLDFVRQAPMPSISRSASPITYQELAWGTVQGILKSAEIGYTQQWVDLCKRMLKSDAHLFSTYLTYVNAIAAARREVRPRQVPAQYIEVAQRAADDCALMLEQLPNIERTIAEMVDADFVAFSVHEIMWEPRGERVVPTGLTWLHQRRFRYGDNFELFLWDDGQAVARARELGLEVPSDRALYGMPLSRDKYVVHFPQMVPDYRTSGGILMSCVRDWWVKSWVTKYALSGAEVAGNPRIIGRLPEAAPPEVQQALFDAITALAGDSVGVLRGETELTVLDAKVSSDGGVWETILKRADAAMSKAVLGSTLNVEVGDTGGNRALGESQKETTTGPRWARSAASLANTIESQLFRPFLEMNRHRYGGMVLVPSLTLHIVEDEPAVDELAVNAGIVTVDELRRSRKLEPLGAERGGDRLVSIAAPTTPFSAAQEAPAALPLASSPKPWARAMSIAGRAATATCTHSPATSSASAPSAQLASPKT